MGLVLALVYARYAEPRLTGPSWWRGMIFSLVPWLLSLVIFLPLMGGGLLGMDIGAGPLPILGNLILHLVYGAVLGSSYAEAAEDWLDDTDVDRGNAASAERGAAIGLAAGLIPGFIVGWLIAPAFDDLVGRPATAIGMAFIGAVIGLAIGSFAGMSRAQTPAGGIWRSPVGSPVFACHGNRRPVRPHRLDKLTPFDVIDMLSRGPTHLVQPESLIREETRFCTVLRMTRVPGRCTTLIDCRPGTFQTSSPSEE